MSTQLELSLPNCEARIGHIFNKPQLLAWALNGSGTQIRLEGQVVLSNKSLALYGDAIMAARLARKWLYTNLTLG
jgi:hypothetical protein